MGRNENSSRTEGNRKMTLSVVKDDRHWVACGCLVAGVVGAVVFVILLLSGGFSAGAHFFLPSLRQDVTAEFLTFVEKQRPGDHHQLVLVEHQNTEKLIKIVNNTYKVPAVDGLEFNDSATVTINCPITYNYYVDLKGAWKITVKDNVVTVEAPPLQLDKPLVDVGRAHRDLQGGGQVFGDDRILQDIARELSTRLYNTAMMPDQFNRFRGPSRKALADFVRAWGNAGQREFKAVNIQFADETAVAASPSLAHPVQVDNPAPVPPEAGK